MKVVVTGGAGYIGSVVSVHLLEAGHEVIVLDNLSNGHREAVPEGARFVQGEISDFARLLSDEAGIDAVLHFASSIIVGESMHHPELYWQNNVIASLQLIEAVRLLGIPRFIFSSTAAVYGNPETIPITEDAPPRPTNTYGMTKLALDNALTSYALAHGLAASSLRYFNVAGAYKQYGERHPVETHLIPLALDAAAGKRDNFSLYGDDYPTPDGTCIRDYIHVADLARAHVLALACLQPGTHAIYNLGNGAGFSNKEVIAAVERVTGKTLRYAVLPRRDGDPAQLIASSKKAQDELGWQPEKASLDEIIGDAWRFYQQNAAD
jgi:UDP-glucose 4-epimerase